MLAHPGSIYLDWRLTTEVHYAEYAYHADYTDYTDYPDYDDYADYAHYLYIPLILARMATGPVRGAG